MPTVRLTFTAVPEYVRTARLVAVAAARRLGVDGAVLEGIRVAVGEACVRAVTRSVGLPGTPVVELEIVDDPGVFVVAVRDGAPFVEADDRGGLGLTLVHGLADVVSWEGRGAGGELRMEWLLRPAG